MNVVSVLAAGPDKSEGRMEIFPSDTCPSRYRSTVENGRCHAFNISSVSKVRRESTTLRRRYFLSSSKKAETRRAGLCLYPQRERRKGGPQKRCLSSKMTARSLRECRKQLFLTQNPLFNDPPFLPSSCLPRQGRRDIVARGY